MRQKGSELNTWTITRTTNTDPGGNQRPCRDRVTPTHWPTSPPRASTPSLSPTRPSCPPRPRSPRSTWRRRTSPGCSLQQQQDTTTWPPSPATQLRGSTPPTRATEEPPQQGHQRDSRPSSRAPRWRASPPPPHLRHCPLLLLNLPRTPSLPQLSQSLRLLASALSTVHSTPANQPPPPPARAPPAPASPGTAPASSSPTTPRSHCCPGWTSWGDPCPCCSDHQPRPPTNSKQIVIHSVTMIFFILDL